MIGVQPSFQSGFARNAQQSEYPGLRKDFVFANVTALGNQGTQLFDPSGNGRIGTLMNMNPATAWIIGQNGYALDLVTDDYIDAPAPDAPFLGDITVLWGGIIDTGSNFRHFAGKHAGNGASNSPFDFRTNSSATPAMALIQANGSNSVSWSGPNVTLGEFRQYGYTSKGSLTTAPTFFIDGVPTVGSGTPGTGQVTGTGENIRIGRRADGVVQMDGKFSFLYIWKRILLLNELLHLSFDFLAPLRLREPAPFFVPAAVGATWGKLLGQHRNRLVSV